MKPDVSGVSELAMNLAGRAVVGDVLTRVAEQFGDRVAIKDPNGSVTFAQLEAHANAIGRGLLGLGIKQQTPVGFLLGNSWQFMATFYGCAKAGIISLPVNLAQNAEEIQYCLADAEVETLIVDAAFVPLAESIIDRLPRVRRIIVRGGGGTERIGEVTTTRWEDLAAADPAPLEVIVHDRDILQCLYSSGTTSRPKGVLTSHLSVVIANLTAAATSETRWASGADVIALIVPLFHTTALNALALPSLSMGGTVIVLPGFEPDSFIDALENDDVNRMMLLPFMYEILLTHPRMRGRQFLGVKHCTYSMAQMPAERIARINEAFPNAKTLLGSGMTECVPPTVFQWPEHEQTKAASWGPPVSSVDVRIMDAEGNLLERGRIGEIVYRGAQVMAGYWNRPETNTEVLGDGWLRTGDIGYKDDEGVIWFTDRAKDIIKSGGENVSSMDVERTILAVEGVLDCGVIGVPHEKWGEAVTAYCVTDGTEVSEEAVVGHCRQHLAGFKVPKQVIFVQELPKTATGKVQKHELRRMHSELVGHDR